MGADRVSECPFCKEMEWSEILAEQEALDADYGKVPKAEFVARDAAHLSRHALYHKGIRETLAQYNDIFVEDGKLHIEISINCRECGLDYKLTESHDILKGAN